MKVQTKLVQNLKVAILKFFKLVELGVKKYIIQLADVEKQLETALHEQLTVLIRLTTETGHQFVERINQIVGTAARKLQMVTGRTDTFGGLSMVIFKRLPHPIKTWTDIQLGTIKIDLEGKILVSFRYGNKLLICPDLETAFDKFEQYYQSTVLKYV